jgi:transposase
LKSKANTNLSGGCLAATLEQLRSLAAWLVEQEAEEVVMESTAQYWKPVWEALERYWKPVREKREGARPRSGTLHLAQALSNRGRRGRKKDFRDAERLVKRLVARELTLSFVPDAEQRLWRTVTRKKYQLRRDRVRLQNQLEALLEEAHIKLSSLVSDLLGVSARRMLKALADGETKPAALAALAHERLRATPEQLCDALGACTDLKPVYRRLLKMALEQLQLLEQQIGQLDQELATLLHPHQDAVQRLAEVPGLGVDSAQQIIAEVGPTAATFPTGEQLSSWVGACPGDEESAGVNYSHRSPKGNRHMRRLLNQAANAAVKVKGSIFEIIYRRCVPRLGHNQAIGLIAHRQCRLIWLILHKGTLYEERGPAVTKRSKYQRTNLLLLTLTSIPPPQTHWMCRYANANHESAKNHLVLRDPAVCCRCGEWSECSEERSGAHGISGACEQLCHRQIDPAELCGMEPRPATFS